MCIFTLYFGSFESPLFKYFNYLGTDQIISILQLAFSKMIAKLEKIPRTTH